MRVVVGTGHASGALSTEELAADLLPPVSTVGGVGVQAGLAPRAFPLHELHAHLRLHLRRDLVGEGAVVASVAASTAAEVAADVAWVAVKILATGSTWAVPIKAGPIATELRLDDCRFHVGDRFRCACVRVEWTTREILRRKTSIINALAFTFESKVLIYRKKAR